MITLREFSRKISPSIGDRNHFDEKRDYEGTTTTTSVVRIDWQYASSTTEMIPQNGKQPRGNNSTKVKLSRLSNSPHETNIKTSSRIKKTFKRQQRF